MAAFLIPLATAAIGAYSANKQAKAANSSADAQQQARIDGINASEAARQGLINQALGGTFLGQYGTSDIFGRRPVGIPYEPVKIGKSLQRSINQNKKFGLPAALDFATAVNDRFSNDVLRLNLGRARTLYPGYDSAVDSYTGATKDLLEGRLPFEDVLGIVSDRQSLSGAIGVPGGAGAATLKDLGISRLGAIETGAKMFQSFLTTQANAVSPIPQLVRPDQIFNYTMLTPETRLNADITQAQLKQQSLQSAEFLAAGPDPAAQALFGAQYQALPYVAGANAGFVPSNIQGPGYGGVAQAGLQAAGNYFQPTAQNQYQPGYAYNATAPAYNSNGLPVARGIGLS